MLPSSDSVVSSSFFVDGHICRDARLLCNSTDADGTAASPSILPGFDNDTGFFKPASNNIGFSTGGTERARIDSSGNLMVGRTATSVSTADASSFIGATGFFLSAKNGTSATSHFQFRNDADSGGVSALVGNITSSGSTTTYSTSSDYRLKKMLLIVGMRQLD